MNNRMLRVNLIPVEDCFAHLSSKLIRELNNTGANYKCQVSHNRIVSVIAQHYEKLSTYSFAFASRKI